MPAKSLIHFLAAPATAAVPVRDAQGLGAFAARALLATALAVGLATGALAAATLAGPPPADAELTRLLHGMVLIKGVIALAATGLIFRRLSTAVDARVLAGYAGGLGLTFAALGWLWGLTTMLVGSVLFYGGLLAAGVAASRDPRLLAGLRRS
jgi:hypothetical protein